VDHAAGDPGRSPARPEQVRTRLAATAALVLGAALAASAASAQPLRTLTSSRQLHGESALAVNVTYVAGRFRLVPAAPGTLYQMEMRYDEDKFLPVRSYDPASGELSLGLRSRGHVTLANRGDEDEVPTLNLALAAGVPIALTVELGAAEADADFGGLALTSLRYKTGASHSRLRFGRPNAAPCDSLTIEAGAAEFTATGLGNANCRHLRVEGAVGAMTLDFTGAARGSADADIHLGLGTLKLVLPRAVGVAITLDRFLATFDPNGFTRRGDVYYSDDYAATRTHLDLKVNSAFGGIEVAWVGASR